MHTNINITNKGKEGDKTMTNNENNNMELETLRQQMEAFKRQLEQQKIINSSILERSMKDRMSWIKKYIIFEICIMPLLVILWIGIKMAMGLSWLNMAFLFTMCAMDIYTDYHINVKTIKDDDYLNENLITTMGKLVKMKRQRVLKMLINVPLTIMWLAWCGIEAWAHLATMGAERSFHHGFVYGGICGGGIGGVIGIVFAYIIYRRMQKTNDAIIKDIRMISEAE